MKAKSQQEAKKNNVKLRVVSEELDKMQDDLERSMSNGTTDENQKTAVKLIRSRRETRVTFIFKGSLNKTKN